MTSRALGGIQLTGLLVFAFTYALISARRLEVLPLDRPAGALLGAVLMVGLGVLSPAEALGAVDGATIVLLFGVMGMGAFLAVDGVFDAIADRAAAWAKTPARLLDGIVIGGGVASAFITNDAVCVLGAPLVVRLIVRHRLPALPYLLALATAANTGSVATLVGNPQNMLVANLGGIAYRDHLVLVGPIAVVGLALNLLVLRLAYRRELADARLAAEGALATGARFDRRTFAVILVTAIAYTAGADLAWTAVGGFVVLMLVHRRDTRRLWAHIDFSLLLFFAGLFVAVEGLMKSGAPAWFFAHLPLAGLAEGAGGFAGMTAIFLFGSNVVSNVPFILVIADEVKSLPNPRLAWELLAVASTFAGNLTLLGSVANIIVAENARDLGGFGFFEHLKVGATVALLTTGLGAAWLYAAAALGWV